MYKTAVLTHLQHADKHHTALQYLFCNRIDMNQSENQYNNVNIGLTRLVTANRSCVNIMSQNIWSVTAA